MGHKLIREFKEMCKKELVSMRNIISSVGFCLCFFMAEFDPPAANNGHD